jgi:hypothetical protein
MSLEDYAKNSLWPMLVETVHALVMYAHDKSYIREVILHEKPNVKSNELAARLGVPLGEALVILHELKERVNH